MNTTAVEYLDLRHLDITVVTKFKKMLNKYSSMRYGSLVAINAVDHHIGLIPGTRAIAQAPYRAGPRARELEATEVLRMLEAGVIQPAQPSWAPPVVLIPNLTERSVFASTREN